jgi:hypothetical protein
VFVSKLLLSLGVMLIANGVVAGGYWILLAFVGSMMLSYFAERIK